ncbi:hypothetical protein BC941DRAFT_414886 [Chlamydoabsidia padenii]|nr:hypothetical protein BC941DRAFT_414886 [Chlamydoabsidia padenii]
MSFVLKLILICTLLTVCLVYTNFVLTDRTMTIPHHYVSPTTQIKNEVSLQTSALPLTNTNTNITSTFTTNLTSSTTPTPKKSPTPASLNINPDEKYLTFFTHSGFQNQLIQVENGILLAWYLNRTLILPKAVLGKPFGWSYFPKLRLEHQLRNSGTTNNCEEYTDEMDRWHITCPDQSQYAMLPFDDIFDLSWAKQHVKIITREQVNEDWLASTLGIHPGEQINSATNPGTYVDGDILYYCGATRYDWRIFDTPYKSQRLGKYVEALDIYELRQRKEKLIHFSSLFGSGRLPIRRPEHYAFLRSLQQSITYHHPAVLKLTDLITNTLGGHGNFIGIHVRSGDGWFVDALPDNIIHIVSLLHRVSNKQHGRQQTLLDLDDPTTQPRYSSSISNLAHCVTAAKNGKGTLVFVATDARNPRSNRAFDPLWTDFPCSFTIHDILALDNDDPDFDMEDLINEDITVVLAAAAAMGWTLLDNVHHPVTGTSMRKFLLPMVDASISSRGSTFIGSKGSTFSGYIHRIHDIFWSKNKKPIFATG